MANENTTCRRALVTGASSGIGAATARLLAREGYRVALLARRADELERVRASCERAGEHLALVCDVRDGTSVRSALQRVAERFGALDLLVNNAGVGYRAKVEELDDQLARALFETNVVGLLSTCREALPLLRRGERAVVVNIASIVGRRGVPGQAAYAASKAAVCSISEALRVEWAGDRIAVCTLSPGLTKTAIFDVQPNPARLPNPSLAGADSPDEVARQILALDRNPRREVALRGKWKWLGWLSPIAPRLSDRLLVRNMGGAWRAPEW
jgi:NAD(P)-dependent dehydrogenase (short-subunit alcohol dehydrogenase family)